MKIIIDAGHGGNESGCTGFGKLEKNLNLQYAVALKAEFDNYKFVTTVMTRTSDYDISISERAKIANNHNADLLISCHLNAFNAEARGTEVIHSIFANSDTISLCNKLGNNISTGLGVSLRRVFSKKSESGSGKDYYGIIRETKCKAIIIEPLFLDNKADALVVFQECWHIKLAKLISNTIASHYKLGLINAINPLKIKSIDQILGEISSNKDKWIEIINKYKDNEDLKNLELLIKKAYYRTNNL